ncbi:hypothetical protein ACROYT_G014596 [Oculina patagonica]
MRAEAEYWSMAARYIKSAAGVQYLRKAQSIRQRVVNYLRTRFSTVSEAEDALGITVDTYIASASGKENAPPSQSENQRPPPVIPEKVMEMIAKLTCCQLSMLATHIMENLPVQMLQSTLQKVLPKVLPNLRLSDVTDLLNSSTKIASRDALLSVADSLVCSVASKTGLSWNVKGFLDTACRAMCELEAHDKPNVVYFLCHCIADKKEDRKSPILPGSYALWTDTISAGILQCNTRLPEPLFPSKPAVSDVGT